MSKAAEPADAGTKKKGKGKLLVILVATAMGAHEFDDQLGDHSEAGWEARMRNLSDLERRASRIDPMHVLRVECSPVLSEIPFATVAEWVRELTETRIDQPIEQVRELVTAALGEYAAGEDGAQMIERMAELATGRVRQAVDEADAV